MVSPLEALSKDVRSIYSCNSYKTTTFEKEYQFENNKVKIVFERMFMGTAVCSSAINGTAVINMEKRDSSLEEKIKEIISEPRYSTWFFDLPVVSEIKFN